MTLDFAKMQAQFAAFTRNRGINYFRAENGPNHIRILPGWPGATVPWVEYVQHFLGGDVNKSFVCLATEGLVGLCDICMKSRSMKKSEVANEAEVGGGLAPQKRFLWNILVRGKEKEGPKILAVGPRIHEPIMTFVLDVEHYPDFLDIYKGIDVFLDRKGVGKQTRYDIRALMNRSSLAATQEETEKLFSLAKNLNDEVKPATHETMRQALAMFLGLDDEPAPATVSFPVSVPYSPPGQVPAGTVSHEVGVQPVTFPPVTPTSPVMPSVSVPAPVAAAPALVAPAPVVAVVAAPPATAMAGLPFGPGAEFPASPQSVVVTVVPPPASEAQPTSLKEMRDRIATRMGKK